MKETKTIDDLNKFMSKKEQAFAKRNTYGNSEVQRTY